MEGHCSQAGSRPFYKTTFEKTYRLPLPARAIKQNNTSSHLLIQDPAERAASKFCGNAVSDQGDGDAQPDVCRTGACEDLPDARWCLLLGNARICLSNFLREHFKDWCAWAICKRWKAWLLVLALICIKPFWVGLHLSPVKKRGWVWEIRPHREGTSKL